MKKLYIICSLLFLFISAYVITQCVVQPNLNEAANTSACTGVNTPPMCTQAFTGMTDSTNVGVLTPIYNPPTRSTSTVSLSKLFYPGFTAENWCELQPWFGEANHYNNGQNMHDTAMLDTIMSWMQTVGCTHVWVDAYSSNVDSGFPDTTLQLIASEIHKYNLKLIILVDQGDFSTLCPKGATDQTTCITNKLISVFSTYNSAYFNQSYYEKTVAPGGGVIVKPMTSVFITESLWSGTCWRTGQPACGVGQVPVWTAVRASTASYNSGNGIWILGRFGSFSDSVFDGEYAWIQPPLYSVTSQLCWQDITGGACNATTGIGSGVGYLDSFYNESLLHLTKFAVGGYWKGFNWVTASYNGGVQKVMDQQACTVIQKTAAKLMADGYSMSRPIYAMGMVTWDDYDEGTPFEMGCDNTYTLSPSLSTNTLNFNLSSSNAYANVSTIDHFNVYYSSDGINYLMAQNNISNSATSVDLSPIIPIGTYQLILAAVGAPMNFNKFSTPIAYTH